LQRHYLPLLDTKFLDLYESMHFYSKNLRFIVNGQEVKPWKLAECFALDQVKEFFPERARKRYGYGIFGLAPKEYPLGSTVCGVLLCTRGKVIKADLFNQFPSSFGPRILGIVEIPELVRFLTTSKTDFTYTGMRKEFERLYDPIRQEFKAWLRSLGVDLPESVDPEEATKLERELKKLIDEVPELAEFFGFRTPKDIPSPNQPGTISANLQEGVEVTFPVGEGTKKEGAGPVDIGDQAGQTLVEDPKGAQRVSPISRSARQGPKIRFSESHDKTDLAWIEGNIIVINSGHPAYVKVRANATTRRLHCLFSIASAIQRFLHSQKEPPDLMFTDRMMAVWGKKQ
jgi:hypothetical protein